MTQGSDSAVSEISGPTDQTGQPDQHKPTHEVTAPNSDTPDAHESEGNPDQGANASDGDDVPTEKDQDTDNHRPTKPDSDSGSESDTDPADGISPADQNKDDELTTFVPVPLEQDAQTPDLPASAENDPENEQPHIASPGPAPIPLSPPTGDNMDADTPSSSNRDDVPTNDDGNDVSNDEPDDDDGGNGGFIPIPLPLPLPLPIPSPSPVPIPLPLPVPSSRPSPSPQASPVPVPTSAPSLPPQLVPLPVPEPKPDSEPAPQPKPGGDYYVQVHATPHEHSICEIWQSLKDTFPHLFAHAEQSVTRHDTDDGSIWFRLRVGSFHSADEAAAFCARLKSDGHDCFVVKPTQSEGPHATR